jgi:ParB family chromosome partitioning protein
LGQLPGWGGAAAPAAGAPAGPAAPRPAAGPLPGLAQPPDLGPSLGIPAGAGPAARSGAAVDLAHAGAADDDAACSRLVALELIEHNPHQPRQDFDAEEIRRLAESLTTHGLLQPVVVRRVHDHYQLVAGERRLRAARQAGWIDVPVRVVEADDRQAAELAIIENLQRRDLNALEKAASFQRYLEQYGSTQEELAGRLAMDRSTIANFIRLLELPETVQDAIRKGAITQGHARALLPLGDEREQIEFCQRIQTEGLNVRQTEEMVQSILDSSERGPLGVVGGGGAKTRSRRAKSEHLSALEQEFRTALGVRVKITHNAKGRGKLVIPFASHEEFERLREHICGPAQPLPLQQVQAG